MMLSPAVQPQLGRALLPIVPALLKPWEAEVLKWGRWIDEHNVRNLQTLDFISNQIMLEVDLPIQVLYFLHQHRVLLHVTFGLFGQLQSGLHLEIGTSSAVFYPGWMNGCKSFFPHFSILSVHPLHSSSTKNSMLNFHMQKVATSSSMLRYAWARFSATSIPLAHLHKNPEEGIFDPNKYSYWIVFNVYIAVHCAIVSTCSMNNRSV